MDPIAAARYGMLAASRRFEASAERVAQVGQDAGVRLEEEVVEQITAKHQFSAQVQTVRIADEMWRDLMKLQDR